MAPGVSPAPDENADRQFLLPSNAALAVVTVQQLADVLGVRRLRPDTDADIAVLKLAHTAVFRRRQ